MKEENCMTLAWVLASLNLLIGAMRLLLFFLFFVTRTTWAAEKPNILVIVADDLGYGDLSCYGATDLQSPHLDALMASGLRFTEFYANCPVCSPTRAALLSGRYQELVGVPGVIRTKPEGNWGYLSPGATLLPQALKSRATQPPRSESGILGSMTRPTQTRGALITSTGFSVT